MYGCHLRIADHVWQNKRAAIGQTVDAMGDQFKLAMRGGWRAYVRQTYPEGAAEAGSALGPGPFVDG